MLDDADVVQCNQTNVTNTAQDDRLETTQVDVTLWSSSSTEPHRATPYRRIKQRAVCRCIVSSNMRANTSSACDSLSCSVRSRQELIGRCFLVHRKTCVVCPRCRDVRLVVNRLSVRTFASSTASGSSGSNDHPEVLPSSGTSDEWRPRGSILSVLGHVGWSRTLMTLPVSPW